MLKNNRTAAKALAIFLCAATMLVSLFSFISCADNGVDVPVTTTAAAETEPEVTRIYPTLTPADYNKYVFKILRYDTETKHGWSGYPNDIWVEKSNGESLNDAIYKRNSKVETDFNITIEMINQTSITNSVQNAVSGGDDPYDLIIQQINGMTLLVESNLVLNLASDLSLDLTYPWWDQNSVEAFTLGGKLYGVVSDITYTDKLSTVVTFFNKSIVADKQIGDLYALATSGGFTFEKMLEYGALAAEDLNNDGKRDGTDAYGISCQNDGSYYFLHGAGKTFITKERDGTIINNTTDQGVIEILQRIFDVMADDTMYFNRQTYGYNMTQVADMFADDRALFLVRPLQTLYELRNYDTPFGILPVPKYTSEQEKYYSSCNTYSASLACVINTAKDTERTSAIMEVLAAESYYQVMPVFYDEVLDYKLNPDPAAIEILDFAFDNRIYDLGIVWNFGSMSGTFVRATQSSVAIASKAIANNVQKAIDALTLKLGG